MSNKKGSTERRKHKRFKVKVDAVVAVSDTESKYTYLGRFIDISKGGFAFTYNEGKGGSTELSKVDILYVRDSFYLYNIPFETMWVSREASKPSPSFSKTSKSGVQFGDMTSSQMQLIDSFIEKFAIR